LRPFTKREKRYPEIMLGMSVYGSVEAAQRRWESCRAAAIREGKPIRIGDYVAEVELVPDRGFSIEDLHDPQEHLTIWGDPDQLAACTRRIYTPHTDEG
jgi:hypothetical protein